MLIAFITVFCLIFHHATVLAEQLCSLNNGMTDEIRKIFLDKHNEYRSLVASGQAPNPRYGGSTPKAARMLKARYDCEVEEDMTKWAQAQCTYAPFRSSKSYGRNTWSTGVPNYNMTAAAESSVNDWFFELRRYGVLLDNEYTRDVDNTAYHYSQMVWQGSYKIGCVVAWCPSMTWVACGYSPAGNNIGSLIYELGEPCTKNEDCRCTGCTCSEGEALCIPPEESNPATTVSITTTTTTVLAEQICSLNNGMTDEIRKIFLDKHNEYRSLVASGQAPNPRYGGSTPKAARMLKARYDCDVEEDMTKWAQAQCTYAPFRSSKRYGRNTWSTGVPNYNMTAAAESSVNDWFFELRRYGVPLDNKYTRDVDSTAYHYSQMVWQGSYKIGCVVAWCPSMTWVACGYSPAGNNIESLIYELGEPCTKNEDCGCSGCTCSKGEALCIPPKELKPATTASTTTTTTTVTTTTTTKPTTTTTEPTTTTTEPSTTTTEPSTTTAEPTTTFDRAAWEESVKRPVAHCTLDNGMTDEVRQVFLDKHNEYRQLVARGEAKNKTGLAPQAARMQQMRYDCDLEAHVMEHVAKCKGGHSLFSVLKGRGQNIWGITVPNLDKAEAAKRSVDDWYIELTKYGITADNKISMENAAKTGHYSQVVWQKSNRLGCAAVSCPEQRRLFVGCEYLPGGNTLRHLIYDVGEPCKQDEDFDAHAAVPIEGDEGDKR